MPLQPRRDASRLGRREGLAGHMGVVRVEVVADQDHLLGLGKVHVRQVAQDGGEIELGAPGRDLDGAPALLGGREHEQVADPVAPVLVVVADRLAGCRRLWHACFRDQLLAGLVHADHRKPVVRGTVVDPGTSSMLCTKAASACGGMYQHCFRQGFNAFF